MTDNAGARRYSGKNDKYRVADQRNDYAEWHFSLIWQGILNLLRTAGYQAPVKNPGIQSLI